MSLAEILTKNQVTYTTLLFLKKVLLQVKKKNLGIINFKDSFYYVCLYS